MQSRQITRSLVVVLVSLFTLLLSTTPVGAWTAPTHDKLQVTITANTQDFTPASTCTVARACFLVTTTNDTHDAHPGDGACADSNGQCSLRAAIEEGDALPSGSRILITVPAGTYPLTLGTLQLTANTITITGVSSKSTIISGNNTFGVMAISPNVSASLSQLTIEGGNAGTANGGGIDNSGTLRVTHSILNNNTAAGGYGGGIGNEYKGTLTVSTSTFSGNTGGGGGGIYNEGTLIVSHSTFSGNTGGGIYNDSSKLTVSHSTISGNTGGIYNDSSHGISTVIVKNSTISGNTGVGIDNYYNHYTSFVNVINSTISGNTGTYVESGGIDNTGTLNVINSTISGNMAGQSGYSGGINNGGALSVTNSTISDNSGGSSSGGISNNGGLVFLKATIVANNTSPNCSGQIRDSGYNLDSGTTCGFSLGTDLTNTDPMLGPLGDNGGPTQTMALLQGSKAIDWVNGCAASRPTTDQRGFMRPDGSGESTCDIGAYESAY